MRGLLVLTVLTFGWVASFQASEPGQPLDCSDWVFLEPGLSCTTVIHYPCSLGNAALCTAASSIDSDNDGRVFFVEDSLFLSAADSPCGFDLRRTQIVAVEPSGTSWSVAYLDDRCAGVDALDATNQFSLGFNPHQGTLYFNYSDYSSHHGFGDPYPAGWQKISINGFATTFDILQTYTPTTNEIGFHVPYMPEGFQFADYFDTYHGDLATVGDWSKAKPLNCGFPTSPPSVGDFLRVADPLPNPLPGHGRYYVTAVTYQGQTRYGRKSTGGVLSGRDPAVLPGCSE